MIINMTGGFRDNGPRWFRSDRMREEDGKWYFRTREGTVEGPYDDKAKAADQLDSYIKLKISEQASSEVPPRSDQPS